MRYIVEGVVRDFEDGKRVALVGRPRGEVRSLFVRIVDAAGDGVLGVRRSSGREGAWHETGGTVGVFTPASVRGFSADVVVALNWLTWSDDDRIGTLPVTAAAGGELLRVG